MGWSAVCGGVSASAEAGPSGGFRFELVRWRASSVAVRLGKCGLVVGWVRGIGVKYELIVLGAMYWRGVFSPIR